MKAGKERRKVEPTRERERKCVETEESKGYPMVLERESEREMEGGRERGQRDTTKLHHNHKVSKHWNNPFAYSWVSEEEKDGGGKGGEGSTSRKEGSPTPTLTLPHRRG